MLLLPYRVVASLFNFTVKNCSLYPISNYAVIFVIDGLNIPAKKLFLKVSSMMNDSAYIFISFFSSSNFKVVMEAAISVVGSYLFF